ncbi:stealth family protein [Latilactobacillus sakei]|uniref:stealth family protein n=1 Tax=Latilactobacillus sakei TaxID=1599 RepID=UPI000C128636|nr:stealth family protein [Latilactobacillus sakei]MDR7925264.1 stealth family protein [Latilactobacillus sakei subsp. sakei]SON73812.1 Exopolysaccharide phosphotransferase cps2G [Latilactobacillus sakei]
MPEVTFPIDFVITWVDQDDPKWIEKYSKYSKSNRDDESQIRFRDYGTLKYVFRGIDKYAPWVRKVYLVTDDQAPEWLEKEYSKLELISHSQIIDKEYLPTFNSNVIDLNLNNIPGLAEHFVYFNDDMFLNKVVQPTDFFDSMGKPKDTLGLNLIMPTGNFDHIYVNNISIINNKYNKRERMKSIFTKFFNFKNYEWNLFTAFTAVFPRFSRFYDPHIQLSFRKSDMEKIFTEFPQVQESTYPQRFRSINDYSIWIVRYYRMLSGDFSVRSAHFGKRYRLNDFEKAAKDIVKKQHKVVNVNDADGMSNEEYQLAIGRIVNAFDQDLSGKSSFEK